MIILFAIIVEIETTKKLNPGLVVITNDNVLYCSLLYYHFIVFYILLQRKYFMGWPDSKLDDVFICITFI